MLSVESKAFRVGLEEKSVRRELLREGREGLDRRAMKF